MEDIYQLNLTEDQLHGICYCYVTINVIMSNKSILDNLIKQDTTLSRLLYCISNCEEDLKEIYDQLLPMFEKLG